MSHLELPQILALLALILAAAKASGWLAQCIGQPAVLGELVAGVILGTSVSGIVDASDHFLHILAEIGVVILLFEIGIETDLVQLFKVGGTSTTTAMVGVFAPFALGYLVCTALGMDSMVCIVAATSLTATSVGITARVLSDLNRLKEPESQVIIGAAVLDDIIGLIILAVVSNLTEGKSVSPAQVAGIAAIAFGFLAAVLVVGKLIVPRMVEALSRSNLPGTPTMIAVMLAFALAWLASVMGSAMIIGAFAAGLLVRGLQQTHEIERGVASLGHFFVPFFFVSVGAAVDLGTLNPIVVENMATLQIGGLLIVAAIVGKMVAGFAPFWFQGNKMVIGVGMIPRGEVGLIFAQMGLSSGIFDARMFSAVTLMVMVTTFIVPPWLKVLFPKRQKAAANSAPDTGIEELVNEA